MGDLTDFDLSSAPNLFDFLRRLCASDFMPHGHCYYWRKEILWTGVLSDVVITLAYYAIPLMLIYFVRKRRDLAFNWIFLCFGAFIFLCGTTHLIGVWTVWHGTYRLDVVVKALTALVSIMTAVLLWRLIPKVLMLKSPEQLEKINKELQEANKNLECSVAERKKVEEDLAKTNQALTEKNERLEKFSRMTVGRELQMAQLKKEIDTLLEQMGKPQKYNPEEKGAGF